MKKMIQMFQAAQSVLTRKARDQKGATMVEYALMVALIAVVCITAVTAIGTKSNAKFGAVSTALAP